MTLKIKNLITLLFSLLIGSFAFSQGSQNITILYHWEDTSLVASSAYNNTYNEVFGFVQAGREYAVIGTTFGTHIFDVTDPVNSLMVDEIPGASQGSHIIHRDYKVYNGYLYSVCDEGGGSTANSTLQIADLNYLPDSVQVVYDSDSLLYRCHNLFVDTATAKLYACSVASSRGFNGFEVYSLANPELPDLLKTFNTFGSVHDAYSKNDTVYLNAGSNFGLQVVSFVDAQNPQPVGSLTSYPFQGYNHSGWINEAGNIYVFADETHGMDLKVTDITDVTDLTVLSTFTSGVSSNSIAHNMVIKGDYVYVSYYYDGLQIFSIADPANPVKTGYYLTSSEINTASYKGAWGVFTLPSGTVLVADMQNGLFVFDAGAATGIEKNKTEREIVSVFPNPFSKKLTIALNNSNNEYINYQVTDLAGRIILSGKITTQGNKYHEVSLINMPEGLYLIKIWGKDFSHVEKLIKAK